MDEINTDSPKKTKKSIKAKTLLLEIYQTYLTGIIFRLLFVIESIVLIHYAICIKESYYFLLLTIFIVLIIVDCIYTVFIRNGIEHEWFSISVASYTAIYIVTIWVLIFYRFDSKDTLCKKTLLTMNYKSLCLKKDFSICVLLDLVVQVVLICFAIGRWSMRIPKLNREAHIEMVIMLICACSDCSDFFNYVNAPHVKDHLGLVILILVVFTISTFQFSVTLTRHYELPKKRNIDEQTRCQKLYELVFCTKIWSILFLLITQDLPYFIVRIVLLSTANLELDRTIYLFTVKNALLIYFDLYQIYYIYKKYNKDLKKAGDEYEMVDLVETKKTFK